MKHNQKEIRELERLLAENGYGLRRQRRGGHYLVVNGDGKRVDTLSFSPGGRSTRMKEISRLTRNGLIRPQ